MRLPSSRQSPRLQRFAWGVSGGSITGLQNFLKDALTLLKTSAWSPLFFLFVAGAAFSAFGGLVLLTLTMKRYDATYSAAMFVGSFVVSASIMSAIHYHTFAHLSSVLDYVCYPGGLMLLLVGVVLLARTELDESNESSGTSSEELLHTPPPESANSPESSSPPCQTTESEPLAETSGSS